ncbi:BTAD domain-containing putative transcriptional regulator [Actinokineospora iranica]|uniref:DNA-binding transcriptional activator of the SARP family n=1 Tax=Actinokineospora iranica TaxID=1271860 RepID=A0A1G6S7W1_9PSEU|nr:BTAD domain-containing putative transcriptional regulator [Actinokineospora iranica]SDD13002.1 DNA-binding transcriptional activator of the SARP family [Actinokineospora iranica]
MIQFRVLGPLDVVCDDERTALGGVKQRALLGRLLLEPNQVVSTSRLVDALWANDEPPVTARKILQNSVWSLRSVLNALPTADALPALVTQPPGYLLSVDEDAVDLHVFRRKVELGREKMANGSPAAAAVILRDALDLWRGDVLADLAEAGVTWPESTLVEKTRPDALELYFEAKIECGHHHAVIDGIEKLVKSEPLRERASGLLMLALYRCGRQTEALDVYSRTRAELVDNFGLQPGPWLRHLQERILAHDPALDHPSAGAAAVEDPERDDRAIELGSWPRPRADDDFMPDLLSVPDWLGAAVPTQGLRARRREATIMIVRAHVGARASTAHPVGVDELLEGIHTLLRTGVECCGGEVLASVGSATIALFNLDDSRENAARATKLALLLRDSLDMSDENRDGLTIRAMVATGDLQWYGDASRRRSQVSVNGTLLDQCWEIFPRVPSGTIWVSDRTKSLTSDQVSYLATAGESPYWVAEARSIDHLVDTEPFMDREHEMEILRRTFQRVERRGTPHLVTVLGDHGTGKSRLLMEFCAMVAEQAGTRPLVLRYRVNRSASVDPAAVAAELRALHHEVDPVAAVRSAERAGARGGAEVLVREIAALRPVVIAVDDLHLADQATLAFFERLGAGGPPGKLLVVAGASEYFHRRFPRWGRSQPNSTRILLEPLSEDAVGRLFENLAGSAGECVPDSTWQVFHRVFGAPDSAAAKRAWLMRALPLVVGTKTFPAEHMAGGPVSVR